MLRKNSTARSDLHSHQQLQITVDKKSLYQVRSNIILLLAEIQANYQRTKRKKLSKCH